LRNQIERDCRRPPPGGDSPERPGLFQPVRRHQSEGSIKWDDFATWLESGNLGGGLEPWIWDLGGKSVL